LKALIFSGGEFGGIPEDVSLTDFSLIIAADKGYEYAKASGVVPHIFVGDFDSLNCNERVECSEVITLKPEKDMTDTHEAVKIAIARGADKIVILGALGGRIDHILANIQLLKYGIDNGVKIEIKDKLNSLILINSKLKINKKDGFNLSLIPMTKCEGVSIKGVYYPLNNRTMDLGDTLGISNEFIEESAEINVKSGLMLVAVCSE